MRSRIQACAACVPMLSVPMLKVSAVAAVFAFAVAAPPTARAYEAPVEAPVESPAPAAVDPAAVEAPSAESRAAASALPPAADPAPPPERAQPAPPAAWTAPDLGAVLANPDYDDRTRLELEILQRVNGVRAERGLGPLQLDDRLVAAARQHAVDMAYRNFCRHRGSDGSLARDRLRRNGYPFNNWAGENILCARRTADAALKWWMNSAPHRANILHGHFTHIGVGVSMLGTYGPDMVLTFAAGDGQTVLPGAFAALRDGNVAGWVASTREPEQRPR